MTSGASGKLHGGPNPIQQARITIWETWTSGFSNAGTGRTAPPATSTYGSQAYPVGTATTDSNGYWSISSFNCDAGEYLYVTATGGKTASNASNPNEVLVAPMGACSALPSVVYVDISELSTLAVAYSLGQFLSEDASHVGDGQQLVYIGAPAANNAAVGSCTGTGSSMTCVASGLGQAFATALSLVPSTSYVSAIQSVTTANTVPTDPLGAMPNTAALIPAAMLNTLGNVLESCVNTSGGTSTGAPASGCGKLFTATTVGSSAPTDTLEAAISIAQNPANNEHTIYTLADTLAPFTPTLTAEPHDFALAIQYPATSTASGAYFLGGGVGLALTANDELVFQGGSLTGIKFGLLTLGMDGSLRGGILTDVLGYPISADNLGNVYYAASDMQLNRYSVDSYTTLPAASNVTTLPAMAVDRNNVLYVLPSPTANNPIDFERPSDTSLSPLSISAAAGSTFSGAHQIVFDPSQTLWAIQALLSKGVLAAGLPGCSYLSSQCSSGVTVPITSSDYGGSLAFSSDGTGWMNSNKTMYHFSGSTILSSTTLPSSANAGNSVIDGGSTIFINDSTNGVITFGTGTLTPALLQPCALSSGATVCTAAFTYGYQIQVDATGALWVASGSAPLMKLLGVGAPAWPYLGYGHPGEMPH